MWPAGSKIFAVIPEETDNRVYSLPMTEQFVSEITASPDAGKVPVRARRTRTMVAWVLIVLFGILTPITIVSGWAVKTVTNTDRFVATMGPLASDPVITTYLADQTTQKLFREFKVEDRVKQQLPPAVQFLAAPLTAQLQTYTDKVVRIFFQSKAFQIFWNKENRYLHANMVAILEGKTPTSISKTQAMIVNFTPVIVTAIDELNTKGITVFNPIRTQLLAHRVVTLQIIDPKQLATARTIFSLAILGRSVLFVLTPVVAIAAILVAWRRRVTALRLAVAGLIGSTVALVLLKVLRTLFTSHAPGSQGPLAAAHVFDALFRYMQSSTTWLIIIFAVLSALLWLIGPSTWATATRRVFANSKTKIAASTDTVMQSEAGQRAADALRAMLAWKVRYAKQLAWAGVIVGALVLIIVQSTGAIVATVIVIAIYEIALALLVIKTRREAHMPSLNSDSQEQHQDV